MPRCVLYQGFRELVRGLRVECMVFSANEVANVYPLSHVICHSPAGFEWGYGGSGPSDLALSILADVFGREEAWDLHQRFKRDYVSRWSREGWRITTVEILAWRRDLEKSTGSMLPVGLEKKLRP